MESYCRPLDTHFDLLIFALNPFLGRLPASFKSELCKLSIAISSFTIKGAVLVQAVNVSNMAAKEKRNNCFIVELFCLQNKNTAYMFAEKAACSKLA